MANDLVTRLLLNSNQFDNNLRNSARQVQNFQKMTSVASKGVTSGFNSIIGIAGKIAPQLGIAVGAFEVFNKTINSSQSLTDAWGRTTRQATSLVDGLFQAVSAGSFDAFITSLSRIANNARDAYNALDALGTLNAFHDKQTSEFARRRAQIRADLKRGIIDQTEAQKQLNGIEKEEQKYLQHTAKTNKNAFYSLLTDYTKSDAGKGWVSKYFYEGGQDDAKKEADKIQKVFDSMKFRQAKQQGNWNAMTEMLGGLTYDEAIRKQGALNNYYQLGDDKIAELAKLWGDANRAEETYYNNLYRDSKIMNKVKTTPKASGGGKTPKVSTTESWSPIPMGDMQGINTNALDPTRLEYYTDSIASLKKQLNDPTLTAAKYVEIKVKLDKAEEELEKFKTNSFGKFDIPKITGLPTPNVEPIKELNHAWEGVANAINSAAGAMGGFGNESVNVAALIAQTIATIALSYAQTLASDQTSKSNIWTFIAAAAGATISMAATIASIHKATGYANGGIIGGNSYHGDNIIARVNSGEMVLNKGQQASLFRLLDGGGLNSSISTGQVQFKIQGKELVGVLNNYNNKQNRAR